MCFEGHGAMQICKWCSFLLMFKKCHFSGIIIHKCTHCTVSLLFVLKGELYNALTGLNIALRARHKEPRVYGSLPFTVLNRPKRKKKVVKYFWWFSNRVIKWTFFQSIPNSFPLFVVFFIPSEKKSSKISFFFHRNK